VIPVIVWSALFEVVFPQLPVLEKYAVADPGDVLSYCVGGLVSAVFWQWHYKSRRESHSGRL
jgi:hypothetical protein